MLSCRRATALASASLDRPLTWRERVALRTHLLICSHCRRAQRQFGRLRRAARELEPGPGPRAARTALPREARERLDARVRDAGAEDR
jgi:predicted anti-sigma-YlaC factor YlaD